MYLPGSGPLITSLLSKITISSWAMEGLSVGLLTSSGSSPFWKKIKIFSWLSYHYKILLAKIWGKETGRYLQHAWTVEKKKNPWTTFYYHAPSQFLFGNFSRVLFLYWLSLNRFSIISWLIWKERNQRVFELHAMSPISIIHKATDWLRECTLPYDEYAKPLISKNLLNEVSGYREALGFGLNSVLHNGIYLEQCPAKFC